MGGGLLFSAATDKVDCGTDFIGEAAGSITTWIKIKGYGGGGGGRIVDNGKVQLNVYLTNRCIQGDTNGSSGVNGEIGSIIPGVWYFVSMTWTAAGAINFYINGVLNGAANKTGGAVVAGTTNLFIGGRNADDRNFNGYIDELRIYSSILSSAEILNLYTKGTVPSGCVAEYLFNEGSGTTANDTVGEHDGTINGSTYSTSAPITTRSAASNRTTI